MKDLHERLDRAIEDNRLDDAAHLLVVLRTFADPPKVEPLAFESIRGDLPVRRLSRWRLAAVIAPLAAAAAAMVLLARPDPAQRSKGIETCGQPALRIAAWDSNGPDRLDSRTVTGDQPLAARADLPTPCWVSMFVAEMSGGQVVNVRRLTEASWMESGPVDLFTEGGGGTFSLERPGKHVVVLTASPREDEIDETLLTDLLGGARSDTVTFDVMALEVR